MKMFAVAVSSSKNGLLFSHVVSHKSQRIFNKILSQPGCCLTSAISVKTPSQSVKPKLLCGRLHHPGQHLRVFSPGAPSRLLNQSALPVRPTKHYNTKDGISLDYALVYKSSVNDKIVFFICFFLGLSVSLSSLYYILVKVLKAVPQGEKMTIPGIGYEIAQLDAAMVSYLLMSFIIVSWFIHRIARLSVVRMYHHETKDSYIGVVKGRGLKNVQIEFGLADIHPIPMRGFLKASNGNVAIHNYPFIVFNADFLIPEYYTKLATDQKNQTNLQLEVPSGTSAQNKRPVRLQEATRGTTTADTKLVNEESAEEEKVKKAA